MLNSVVVIKQVTSIPVWWLGPLVKAQKTLKCLLYFYFCFLSKCLFQLPQARLRVKTSVGTRVEATSVLHRKTDQYYSALIPLLSYQPLVFQKSLYRLCQELHCSKKKPQSRRNYLKYDADSLIYGCASLSQIALMPNASVTGQSSPYMQGCFCDNCLKVLQGSDKPWITGYACKRVKSHPWKC